MTILVTPDYRINALIAGETYGWNPHAHTPVHITYNYVSGVSADFIAYAETAMNAWSAVANITYTLDPTKHNAGDTQVSFDAQPMEDYGGLAGIPVIGADNHLRITITTLDAFNDQTFIHEIGHTLGLKHPFDGWFNLPPAENNTNTTVMAYNNANAGPNTPMLYDILTVQYLFGANYNYNAGNTVYTFEQGKVMTIWDGGGNDTFDTTNYSFAVTIDLREGINNYSTIGPTSAIDLIFSKLSPI